MNQQELAQLLSDLPLGDVKHFDSIGSTNDEALAWASKDAKDLSLVVAEEQTMGRGRYDRPWITPHATALAFSLILRPSAQERSHLSRIVGLTALALTDSFQKLGLRPEIKWPNDILLNSRKVAGVLIELVWSGDEVACIVVGVGVNILKGAVPSTDILRFPSTSLETALEVAPDRYAVLRDILSAFIERRPLIGTDTLMNDWGKLLAYRGRQVRVEMGGDQTVQGNLLGLGSDGSLRIRTEDGKSVTVRFGDVRLRPFA